LFSKLIVTWAVAVEPDRLSELGETVQVECGGCGPQLSDTTPTNPFADVTVSVYVARCPGEIVSERGDTVIVKSTICSDRLTEGLEVKFVSPAYVAVTVRVIAVEKVIEQEPEGAEPVQLSPVLAFTVTVPEGVSVSPLGGETEKLKATA